MGELSGLRFDLAQIVRLPLGIDLGLASTAVLSDGHERPMLANPWRASRPDCGASSATTFVSGMQPCAGRDWIRPSVLPRAPASSRPAAGDAPRPVSYACTPASPMPTRSPGPSNKILNKKGPVDRQALGG